jgi:hypothetical protein
MTEHSVERDLAGETEVSEKNLSHCHSVHHKSHTNCSSSNPDRPDEKPSERWNRQWDCIETKWISLRIRHRTQMMLTALGGCRRQIGTALPQHPTGAKRRGGQAKGRRGADYIFRRLTKSVCARANVNFLLRPFLLLFVIHLTATSLTEDYMSQNGSYRE